VKFKDDVRRLASAIQLEGGGHWFEVAPTVLLMNLAELIQDIPFGGHEPQPQVLDQSSIDELFGVVRHGGDENWVVQQAPQSGYPMSLVGEDRHVVIAAVNQGIDAHLEACFVPSRGDRFRLETPAGIRGRISGLRLECTVSAKSLPTLIRRLMAAGDETADSLASSICQTLDIELV
jgi:hypothetical protein